MDTALMIAAIIALVVLIILAIFAMTTLSSFSKLMKETSFSIDRMSKDINELKDKIIITLSNLDDTSRQLTLSSQNIERETVGILEMFQPFKHLLNDLYYKIGGPLMQAATIVSASTKAFNVFTNFLTKK